MTLWLVLGTFSSYKQQFIHQSVPGGYSRLVPAGGANDDYLPTIRLPSMIIFFLFYFIARINKVILGWRDEHHEPHPDLACRLRCGFTALASLHSGDLSHSLFPHTCFLPLSQQTNSIYPHSFRTSYSHLPPTNGRPPRIAFPPTSTCFLIRVASSFGQPCSSPRHLGFGLSTYPYVPCPLRFPDILFALPFLRHS